MSSTTNYLPARSQIVFEKNVDLISSNITVFNLGERIGINELDLNGLTLKNSYLRIPDSPL
jgi:hypothetical protein